MLTPFVVSHPHSHLFHWAVAWSWCIRCTDDLGTCPKGSVIGALDHQEADSFSYVGNQDIFKRKLMVQFDSNTLPKSRINLLSTSAKLIVQSWHKQGISPGIFTQNWIFAKENWKLKSITVFFYGTCSSYCKKLCILQHAAVYYKTSFFRKGELSTFVSNHYLTQSHQIFHDIRQLQHSRLRV